MFSRTGLKGKGEKVELSFESFCHRSLSQEVSSVRADLVHHKVHFGLSSTLWSTFIQQLYIKYVFYSDTAKSVNKIDRVHALMENVTSQERSINPLLYFLKAKASLLSIVDLIITFQEKNCTKHKHWLDVGIKNASPQISPRQWVAITKKKKNALLTKVWRAQPRPSIASQRGVRAKLGYLLNFKSLDSGESYPEGWLALDKDHDKIV